MSERHVPTYDPDAARKLARELGISEEEAIRIAATTMDGASSNSRGGINATQTNCNQLHYDEHISRSPDQRIAEAQTQAEAAKALGVNIRGLSPVQAQKVLDAAVSERYLK